MANPNNVIIYIRNTNMEKWKQLDTSSKSGFVNWCLETGKLEEYLRKEENGKERFLSNKRNETEI